MSPNRAVPQRGSDAKPDDAPDRRSFRRNYVLGNAFEWWVAVAAVLSGVTYFVAPASLSESSVGQQAGSFAVVWSILYLVAGLFLVHGLYTPNLRTELAGLSLFAGAVAINVTAILAIRGPQGYGGALTFVALIAAALMRAWLVRGLLRRGQGG